MKRKVKKFGSGGDVLTGLGAGLIGYHLYNKYMGDDKDKDKDKDKELEAVGGPGRRPRTIEEQTGRKAEPEKRREIGDYMTNKPEEKKGGETRPGPDTAEPNLDYTDKVVKPKPAVKKAAPAAQPKKAEPVAQPKKVELPKPGESKVVGEGELKPYPKDIKKPEPPVTGKSTPKASDDTSKKATKYGIGPYGAFGSVHKAISEYKTPAEVRSEERRKREKKESDVAGMKKGGVVKSSASRRADGIAQRGKTRGRIC